MILVDNYQKKKQAEVANVAPVVAPTSVKSWVPFAVVEQPKAPVVVPNKWGFSPEDLDVLTKNGYTPEKLDALSAPFDPSKGENILSRYYQSTISEPSVPDKKKQRNKRTIAGIADGLGMLAQMYSAAKGAHVKERDYNQSAMAKTEGEAKEMENRYLQLSQRYDDALLNTRLKDFYSGMEDYKNKKADVNGVLVQNQVLDQNARELGQESGKWQHEKLYKATKDEGGRDQKTLGHTNSLGANRAKESIGRVNASKKSSNVNKGFTIRFAANANDGDAQVDQFGNKVKHIELTEAEVDQYARLARANSKFMKRHPNLTIQSKGVLGDKTEKLRNNKDIAAAWVEEDYNRVMWKPWFPAMPSVKKKDKEAFEYNTGGLY